MPHRDLLPQAQCRHRFRLLLYPYNYFILLLKMLLETKMLLQTKAKGREQNSREQNSRQREKEIPLQ